MEKYFISLLSDNKIIRHHFVYTNQLKQSINQLCLLVIILHFITLIQTIAKYKSENTVALMLIV
jgi:hypothetical protein